MPLTSTALLDKNIKKNDRTLKTKYRALWLGILFRLINP